MKSNDLASGHFIGISIGLALFGQSLLLQRLKVWLTKFAGIYTCLLAVTLWVLPPSQKRLSPVMLGVLVLYFVNVCTTGTYFLRAIRLHPDPHRPPTSIGLCARL